MRTSCCSTNRRTTWTSHPRRCWRAALEEFNGTVLVISHDRYFLDRIVDRVAGLEGGAAREIVGGYSDYAG